MENVWARHQMMADFVRGWRKKGSHSSAMKNMRRTRLLHKEYPHINVAEVIAAVQKNHNVVFGNGYKKLKDLTFRIAHMGDISLNDMQKLTSWIDEVVG